MEHRSAQSVIIAVSRHSCSSLSEALQLRRRPLPSAEPSLPNPPGYTSSTMALSISRTLDGSA
jgi:hypothetical protein